MAAALKCPNASCPFLFDPTQVPAGAVLTCPRCGLRFVLGPQPANAAAPPAARISAPAPPPTSGWPWFVTGVVCAVVAAAVAGGFFLLNNPGPAPPAGPTKFADYNFSWDPPGEAWEKITDPPPGLKANLFAYRKTDGEARVAFFVSDFKTRNPQPADLRAPLLERLYALFEDLDPQTEKGAEWLGKPAVKYTFRGKDRKSGELIAGDAVGAANSGIAYWTIAWDTERDIAGHVAAIDEVRGRFKLLDGRADWKPTAAAVQTFAGDAVAYRIVDTDRWWSKPPEISPQDAAGDPHADLFLRATYKTRAAGDIKPTAELVCYVLDGADDPPLDAARKLIAARYKMREPLFGKTTLTDITGEPEGDPPGGDDPPATEVLRMQAGSAKDPGTSKLLVVAGIAAGGKTVIAEAACPWTDRVLWERRLMAIVGSLRPGRE